MNGNLPGPLIEAGNWMICFLFSAMLYSAGVYFFKELQRYKWNIYTSAMESKASWAATVLFFGLFLRFFDVAFVRHFQNHGRPVPWPESVSAGLLIFSTVPILWGSICWMRAVLPLSVSYLSWVALSLIVIVAGVFLAF